MIPMGYDEKDIKTTENKEFLKGFDWCVKEIINLFNGNTDIYELSYDGDIDLNKVIEKASDEIKEMIEDWAESCRDELVVSMLDDEYEEGEDEE